MTTLTMDNITIDGTEYHVTSTRNGGIYGHATKHCDEAGCSGDERFLGASCFCHGCGEVVLSGQNTHGGESYCDKCEAAPADAANE